MAEITPKEALEAFQPAFEELIWCAAGNTPSRPRSQVLSDAQIAYARLRTVLKPPAKPRKRKQKDAPDGQ